MKCFAIDYYGGMVPAQTVSIGGRWFDLPTDCKTIIGYSAAVSVFGPGWFPTGGNSPYYFFTPGMHADTWLSFFNKAPGDKAGPDVFGYLKTGDAGHDHDSLMGLSLEIPSTPPQIKLNWWVHNMRGRQNRDQDDWHAGYVFYYV
jgi:hypothetical protein